ncbi:HK97 gp10 family phage protein [Clostridium tertium]|uniref:HK97 gp10 family phage protein n=1 Tax=Clostridium tertium TaxID=1559 RepID=UPI00232CEE84|nr:HK97 gp10 family phage protein [Clostridium tertium]MDB1943740.1 HK97 gp10 family phage protein [Clostridium tertium]MDB1951094.1 HK97 gp10 family phage protein [Clostridium tertium]
MGKSKITGISNEFAKILSEYKEEVMVGMTTVREQVAKETVKELKSTSPKKKGAGGGKYAKGWKVSDIRGRMIIHNKKYQLTHLLEYGHAKVNGGRVAAKVHIRPAEERAIESYIIGVEKVIKR